MNKYILIVIILILSAISINFGNKIKILKNQINKKNQELKIANKYLEQLNNKINKSKKTIVENSIDNKIDELMKKSIKKSKEPKLNLSISSEKLREELENNKKKIRFIPNKYPIQERFIVTKRFSKSHKAIDFAAEVGTQVVASAAGVVISIKEDKFLGKVLILDHLNGFLTLYAHLSKTMVKEKYFVEKGELIGFVGNSGNSKNPHLHFEIIKNGVEVNPESILKNSLIGSVDEKKY